MKSPKQKESYNRRQALMGQILQYLTDHQEAKDTVEGILTWWLPSHPIQWEQEQVQEALDTLVAKGWLVKRMLRPSKRLYSVNNKNKKEVKVFLQTLESEAELKDI